MGCIIMVIGAVMVMMGLFFYATTFGAASSQANALVFGGIGVIVLGFIIAMLIEWLNDR